MSNTIPESKPAKRERLAPLPPPKWTYHEVRKELRRRYPKHSWPDDPLTARPPERSHKRDTTG